jgi:hypothetical protein
VHFCNIGGLNAARLQKRTYAVRFCITREPAATMMQKCTPRLSAQCAVDVRP